MFGIVLFCENEIIDNHHWISALTTSPLVLSIGTIPDWIASSEVGQAIPGGLTAELVAGAACDKHESSRVILILCFVQVNVFCYPKLNMMIDDWSKAKDLIQKNKKNIQATSHIIKS